MSRLICIDPGLDCTGVAVFGVQPVRSQLVGEGMRHLRGVTKIETPSEMRIAPRLAAIRAGIVNIISAHATAIHADLGRDIIVLVEEPAMVGAYDRKRAGRGGLVQANAAGMAKLYQATGAILSAVAGYAHTLVRAGMKKEQKRAIVEQAIKRYPPNFIEALPRAKDGKIKHLSQDVVDAIALGLTWDGWRIR